MNDITADLIIANARIKELEKELASCKKALDSYIAAKRDGRLVELPCKVGDTVYISGDRFAAEIEQIVIDSTHGITFEWTEYDRGPEETEVWDTGWFVPEDIGKTVFLTREEAERTLKGEAE